MKNKNFLKIKKTLLDSSRITGYTHTFYRYPASFSNFFVRETIKSFTNKNDLVFDPFLGGGASSVESIALGRNFIGCDRNALACFISKVKTKKLTKSDINIILDWTQKLIEIKKLKKIKKNEYQNIKEFSRKDTWRIAQFIEGCLFLLKKVKSKRAEDFLRCAILKTAQWSYDWKKTIPEINVFHKKLISNILKMVVQINTFNKELNKKNYIKILHKSAEKISLGNFNNQKPKLIITSPPYPGIHITYSQWAVKSRKVTSAPYWISNQPDGYDPSYYTLGSTTPTGQKKYFNSMEKIFSKLNLICDQFTNLVQLIAFNDPKKQLREYLNIMSNAGFKEYKVKEISNSNDGRLWRDVPNRKWHASNKGLTNSSKEVLLVHKKK